MVRSINVVRYVFVVIRLMQTEAGRLKAGGIEKTWRFDQHSIVREVDVVRETVRDVVFLHNELFFDAAQKK
ncbi:hypothetical protein Tco_0744164 [Tanacetum coccineum]